MSASKAEFVNRLEACSTEIVNELLALVSAAKLVNNEHADRQGVELKVASEAVVGGVQTMFRLIDELRLSALMCDINSRNFAAIECEAELRSTETQERDRVKRLRENLDEAIEEIEHNLRGASA